MPALGAVAGVVGWRLARTVWSAREYGSSHCALAQTLALVTGGAMAGWFAYAAVARPVGAVIWLLVATLPLAGWYWLLWRDAEPVATAMALQSGGSIIAPGAPAMFSAPWAHILEQAGFPGVAVAVVETPAGVTLTVRPDPHNPITADDMAHKVREIAVRAAYAMPTVPLRQQDVRVEEAEQLPNILVHFFWKRPLRRSVEYMPSALPRDINQPVDLGLDEVGDPVAITLPGLNGKIVAMSGGGKSVLANVLIARITECTNATIWIGASDKLVPLVYPWLRPWFQGLSERPAIERVAGQDPRDVLDMLADVYLYVRLVNARNTVSSKHTATTKRPALIVFIEETGDLVSRKAKVTTYDGETWTASGLINRIDAMDRSACVSLILMNQAALVDALGGNGSEIDRNIPLRVCGKTMRGYDGQATLPALPASVDTAKLRDNMLYIQPAVEEPRAFPWKAYHLEDAGPIAPIAIRNAAWRAELDPVLAAQLQTHVSRWDAARLPELAQACAEEGLHWPGSLGVVRPLVDEDDEEDGAMQARVMMSVPDSEIDDTVSAINELTAKEARWLLPSPMDEIEELLNLPNAPQEFVPSVRLAIALGRVSAEAEKKDLEQAAWRLSRDLQALPGMKELRTVQRHVGGGKQRRGYPVSRLRAAFDALRGGTALAAGDDAAAEDGSTG